MSFSAQVKTEISDISPHAECCYLAEAYGLLLFGRQFQTESVSILTEHGCVAAAYEKAIGEVVGAKVKNSQTEAGKYIVSAVSAGGRRKILKAFSAEDSVNTYRINRANLPCESGDMLDCCVHAFLRGAFLSCGTISDPNKNYHMEFAVSHKRLAEDLVKVLSEADLHAKITGRRGSYVVYFKDSKSIRSLLTYMGAINADSLFDEITRMRGIRNQVNRRTNFDTANITRTADAAARQIAAIETIKQYGEFDALPQQLRAVAVLRAENCDMTLSEIGQTLTPPVSRSGVNHRLAKLIDIADGIRSAHGGAKEDSAAEKTVAGADGA